MYQPVMLQSKTMTSNQTWQVRSIKSVSQWEYWESPVFVWTAACSQMTGHNWELWPAPGTSSPTAADSPLPWGGFWTFWMEGQGSACYVEHLAGVQRARNLPIRGSVLHRLVHYHLPGDCAYRNDFFVKIHNSKPALASGFCFITLLYWSRKK